MQLNRSFSRRIGKSLSTLQKELLEFELPKYLFVSNRINKYKNAVLEIGFGMGEHFIHQAKLNSETLFIGAEPYLNGVANVLKLAQEHQVENFLLWPDDLDIILNDLPNEFLDGIFILFPDPWPKRKQNKKRILNNIRLDIFKSKLKNQGFLVFASDIENYFDASKILVTSDSSFKLIDENFEIPHKNYIITKYHQKAIANDRVPKFLKAMLK